MVVCVSGALVIDLRSRAHTYVSIHSLTTSTLHTDREALNRKPCAKTPLVLQQEPSARAGLERARATLEGPCHSERGRAPRQDTRAGLELRQLLLVEPLSKHRILEPQLHLYLACGQLQIILAHVALFQPRR